MRDFVDVELTRLSLLSIVGIGAADLQSGWHDSALLQVSTIFSQPTRLFSPFLPLALGLDLADASHHPHVMCGFTNHNNALYEYFVFE